MGDFTQLNGILDFNEVSLVEEFMESLDKIFQYGHQDSATKCEVPLKLGLTRWEDLEGHFVIVWCMTSLSTMNVK